ncbi:2OG-Fe(II) oxygenase [Eleftheria terrae]|uniref:2OG-Fe(II) oxygenase n=1 Tax=Eleftheria terrae TaxID=1597781 RepID=UPI00263BCE86|nr:2OG-Fe(II) oxygenase [Eleftheria terrae]WKB55808.1 2OG-Fe(II) oxygenase [Eleftheria terrae]
MMNSRKHFHDPGNRSCRIDIFDELSGQALAAVRQFARRIGAPHLVDEVVLPSLAEGDCQIVAAVRDRPWPPWGLGAREIVALCMTQSVADASYAVSPIYTLPQELTNVGMMSAVYKEALDQLAVRPRAELCYLAAEDSTLADDVLCHAGFERTEDVFVTWQSRYNTYRAPVQKVLAALSLEQTSSPELLAHAIEPAALREQALFHHTIHNGSLAEWATGESLRSELIRLVRGGHSGKPGGVPGGTGRWEWVFDPEIRFAVSINHFLGAERDRLLAFVLEAQDRFRPATVDRGQGRQVDEKLRRASTLDDLGEFAPHFEKALLENLEPALKRLQHPGFPVGRIEMQVTASGDGDYFRLHADTDATDTREISFVYYFHREPRRFSGGELRLYQSKRVNDQLIPADHPQTLSPRQDMLLLFPSTNDHEVLPVRVPSGEFADSRFTLNGWIHRKA